MFILCCVFCKGKDDENCCKKTSFILTIIFLGSIGFGALFGCLLLQEMNFNSNGFTCSIYNIFYTLIEGEKIDKGERWIGLKPIYHTIENEIESIEVLSKKIFDIQNKTFNHKKYSEGIIFLNKFENETLLSPLNNHTKLTPLYIDQYTNELHEIQSEYNNNILQHYSTLTSFIEAISYYVNQSKSFKNKIYDSLDEIDTTLSDFSIPFLTQMNQFQIVYNSISYHIGLVYFGLFLMISLLSIILLGIKEAKNKSSSCFLIILWIITNLFVILSFLLSSLFGLIGIASLDGVGLIEGLIQKMPEINNCINNFTLLPFEDYSDLLKELKLKKEEIDNINTNQFETNYIKNINMKLLMYKEDFSLTLKEINISDTLSEINNNLKNEQWSIISSKCPDNFSVTIPNEFIQNGTNQCLLFKDWTTEQIYKLYDNNEILEPLLKIKLYQVNNNNLLDLIVAENNKLEQTINIIHSDFLFNLKETQSLYENNDFFIKSNDASKINCVFLKQYMKVILYEMNLVSSTSLKVSSVILSISISGIISLFFFIILLRNKSTKKEQERGINSECDSIIGMNKSDNDGQLIEMVVPKNNE